MQALTQLISQLKKHPASVEMLWTNHQSLWEQLNFNKQQVALWLASLSLTSHQTDSNVTDQAPPDITEHVASLLRQAGKPLPIALVLKKLPAGITLTEQQLKKMARMDPRLRIKGPLLVLIN